jgi:tetratricopeptide (TPR) repeat protein
MKTKLALAILMLSASLAGAQEKMADQLRKGVVEEEVNQNLDKAIQIYLSVLKQFDDERPAAAAALFRLADCFRKLGRNDEAIAAYSRIVREFPDQKQLADASRTHLSRTFGSRSVPPTEVPPKSIKAFASEREIVEARRRHDYRMLLLEEIKLLEEQLASYQKKVEIGTISPVGAEMTALKRDILELKRTLLAFDAGAMPIPSGAIKK